MSATLGSFYWLGFETSGLPPDKKRLALLGAQRSSPPMTGDWAVVGVAAVGLIGHSVGCLVRQLSFVLFSTFRNPHTLRLTTQPAILSQHPSD
jgi:hypothetical protein